ncbi:MAG TPA: D-alanine--D-alanine ligase family protein [Anaerolineaceae bacterium]
MAERIRLGVLFGGRSGEHEVSLMSARSILSVLDAQKYEVIQIGITHDGAWFGGSDVIGALEQGTTAGLTPVVLLPEPDHNRLYARQNGSISPFADLDVIFPILHGTGGEDGALQGLLEMAGIAYVGSGVLASSVGMDKALFKDVMRAHGLPVVPSLLLTRRQIEENLSAAVEACEDMADYPLFTKPANLGSSVGISKCTDRAELISGLREAARYDRRVLVEQGIQSPIEIEASVLGNDRLVCSLPGEVRPNADFYSYEAKYFDDSTQLFVPADLPAEIIKQIRRLAIQACHAVDCAGMARVDFLIEPNEYTIYIGEINTIPGFTRISMYPKLWEASGLPYATLIDRLIELALERKAEQDHTERRFGRNA